MIRSTKKPLPSERQVRDRMYSFDSRVRYSEVDRNLSLDIFSMINYFQDCSTFQSEDLGVGIAYLKDRHRIWLMHAWQIVISRFPKLGERITVGTWAYDFKSMYGYRNFIIQNEDGTTAAAANSIWVYMDTENGRPVRIPPDEVLVYPHEAPYPMEYAPRKIAPPEIFTRCEPFSVSRRSLDSNDHVNNGQYIRMAENYLPEGFPVRQMRAEYKKSAVLGDIIVPQVSCEGSRCTVCLADEQGKPFSVVEFSDAL